jgi:hypothetical protein
VIELASETIAAAKGERCVLTASPRFSANASVWGS